MKITISKAAINSQNKCHSYTQKQQTILSKQEISAQMANQKKEQNSKPKGQKLDNQICCDSVLFSLCLQKTDEKKGEVLDQVQIVPEQIKYNQQKFYQNESQSTKFKVISNESKEKHQFIFPKNLEVLRKIKQKHLRKNPEEFVKPNPNKQVIKNTEVCISRQESVISSLTKHQINSRLISVIQSCTSQPATISPKKLNLTVSRRSKQIAQEYAQITQKDEVEALVTSKKSNQNMVVDKIEVTSIKKSYYFTEKNIQGSQSEFKIVDPLDEFKSINTQYLKKKIAFSSVFSQKQQFQNYMSQSIFYIQEKNVSSFIKKIERLEGRSQQLCKELATNQQELNKSQQSNSKQSIVLEKNFQHVFEFSIPTFSKIPTSEENPNNNTYFSKKVTKQMSKVSNNPNQ